MSTGVGGIDIDYVTSMNDDDDCFQYNENEGYVLVDSPPAPSSSQKTTITMSPKLREEPASNEAINTARRRKERKKSTKLKFPKIFKNNPRGFFVCSRAVNKYGRYGRVCGSNRFLFRGFLEVVWSICWRL